VDLMLDAEEARVLGALMEKETTTPEYYPMTLNALVNACNQKSNRDPVVAYEEDTVEQALDRLREKKLVYMITGAGMRVPKYSHRFAEMFNFGRREQALICVLMLRGPQTLGELRDRTERMHSFTDLEEVEATLNRLAEFDPPMTRRLPKQPGTKEPRWIHLLSGEPAAIEALAEASPAPRPDRMAALEFEVTRLREDVEDLKQQLAAFRRQFE
jgi:hypothetical protein